jgi:hypothetical protein
MESDRNVFTGGGTLCRYGLTWSGRLLPGGKTLEKTRTIILVNQFTGLGEPPLIEPVHGLLSSVIPLMAQ